MFSALQLDDMQAAPGDRRKSFFENREVDTQTVVFLRFPRAATSNGRLSQILDRDSAVVKTIDAPSG